jgi:hypothetical protein
MISPIEWIRGFLYFQQQASCYILGACAVIGLPICLVVVIAYVVLRR